MKNIVTALAVLSLITISCTDSDESQNNQTNQSVSESNNQPNQSVSESKSPKGDSAGVTTSGTGGFISKNSIPKARGLSAKAASPTKILLSWDTVPDATTYWIYRGTYVAAIIPGTKYTDIGGIKPGTKYTYAIAPVVKSVLGPKSDSVTVTTPR